MSINHSVLTGKLSGSNSDGQGSGRLDIHKTPHAHEDVPAGAHVLYFEDHVTINSFERLRSIHDLMGCALDELVRLGIASPTPPENMAVKTPFRFDVLPATS